MLTLLTLGACLNTVDYPLEASGFGGLLALDGSGSRASWSFTVEVGPEAITDYPDAIQSILTVRVDSTAYDFEGADPEPLLELELVGSHGDPLFLDGPTPGGGTASHTMESYDAFDHCREGRPCEASFELNVAMPDEAFVSVSPSAQVSLWTTVRESLDLPDELPEGAWVRLRFDDPPTP